MQLRIWNDIYYLHSCPNQGYADVSEYIKDKDEFYLCVNFCKFKFPSLICTTPLPKVKLGSFIYENIYGHRVISCNIKKREVYEILCN